ncbi:hypothetical protein K0M31_015483 [Melipona bicolor]|uniref:Uncharacterized protein n=1 Tax=Melipona bicolor TaxID=60889 RepID=A0AA40FFG4_9HYME|nr:hypothetical protein K0M31_015483 [Melipona bicolor]
MFPFSNFETCQDDITLMGRKRRMMVFCQRSLVKVISRGTPSWQPFTGALRIRGKGKESSSESCSGPERMKFHGRFRRTRTAEFVESDESEATNKGEILLDELLTPRQDFHSRSKTSNQHLARLTHRM